MGTKKKKTFTVNLSNYGLESAYRAAYSMLDSLYFRFDKKGPTTLLVEIKPKAGIAPEELGTLKDEFFNELLNSELRSAVARRTKKIREALIAQALIGASADRPEYLEDPLGIATPWEEKYGSKKKSGR